MLDSSLIGIFVNSMRNEIEVPSKIKKYDDDMFLFTGATTIESGMEQKGSNAKLMFFFQSHRLEINAHKIVHCFLYIRKTTK